jgi:hypothetical protein
MFRVSASGTPCRGLEGVAFADVIAVPGDGWATDAADGDDENEDPISCSAGGTTTIS